MFGAQGLHGHVACACWRSGMVNGMANVFDAYGDANVSDGNGCAGRAEE